MEIRECDKATWDSFVDSSPQCTVFCKSYYLESYKLPVRYLQCLKGEEVISGFAFAESAQGIVLMPFQVYCGIIFKNLSHTKLVSQNDDRFSALEYFAEYLFNKYAQVSFINHWDIIDMRPFQWLNYHERDKGYYTVSINYTSLVDISAPKDVSGYRKGRKSSLAKTERTPMQTRESSDIEILDFLHHKTFERQGINRSEQETGALRSICTNLVNAKAGSLLVTYINGEPASAGFFGYDRLRAYYIFGASDPTFREHESGTKNVFDAFAYLHETVGIKEIDMVGVNSPQRGSFKLSFGGSIVPYYIVTKILP